MVVQHNMQAANANRMLGITTGAQAKSTEKLSSGYKINRAADDAAGLAISEKMRSQIRGLDRASTNAQDGISVVQTAEGALNEVHSMLQRMNELATQAANDTNTTIDRSQIQLEVDQLTSEIDRVSSTTQFNTQNLLDGSFKNKNLQVGSLSGQKIELNIGKMSAEGLGLAGETTLDKVDEQHATLTASDVTAKAAQTSQKKVADIFDGTAASTAQNTKYIYDKARDVWHKDGDPTGADAGIKLKANFTADDGATYTFGTSADGSDAIVTGINEGGAKVTDIQISDADLKGKTDGVYKFDGTDWINQSDSTIRIGKANVKTGGTPAPIDAANGSTITLSGYKAEVAAGTKKDLTLKVDSFENAGDAMERIQKAIDKVSTQRAELGAVQNRLEHTIANLDNVSENTQAAESRIRDTDMAKEMVTYSKNNILAQAGQSMLAQANQSNQGVLSLLQ